MYPSTYTFIETVYTRHSIESMCPNIVWVTQLIWCFLILLFLCICFPFFEWTYNGNVWKKEQLQSWPSWPGVTSAPQLSTPTSPWAAGTQQGPLVRLTLQSSEVLPETRLAVPLFSTVLGVYSVLTWCPSPLRLYDLPELELDTYKDPHALTEATGLLGHPATERKQWH